MVTGPLPTAKLRVDVCALQPGCESRTEQQKVHAKTRVAVKGVRIDPERVDFLVNLALLAAQTALGAR